MTGTEKLRIKLTAASVAKHLIVPDSPGKPTLIYDTELAGFGVYRASDWRAPILWSS
jgi:hypothetical protein